MNWLLMLLILVVACVIAWVLMQRMFEAQERLAQLHDELKSNDNKLKNEMQRLNDEVNNQSNNQEIQGES